jgi:hypothetical protein
MKNALKRTLLCGACGKELGRFGNYGREDTPLCFDCANQASCEECSGKLPPSQQRVHNGRKLCPDCHAKATVIEAPETDATFGPLMTQAEEKPYIPAFNDESEMERHLNGNHKIHVRLRNFIFITAALIFPFSGGIKELLVSPGKSLDALHLLCVAAYAVYFLWLWRLLVRRVIPDKNGMTVVNWLSTKRYDFDEMNDIYEIEFPEHDLGHQKYAGYKTYLFIFGKAGKSVLKQELVRNYITLKKIVEFKLKRNLQHFKKEKSGIQRILETIG